MIDVLILIISLISAATLYIVISRRINALEQKLTEHDINDQKTGQVIVKLLDQLNVLTDSHNHIVDVVNSQHKKQEQFKWKSHEPFINPNGEA